MIARMWRGWTKPEGAAGYEEVFNTIVLPHLHSVSGCKQAFLFRRELSDEVEFAVLTMFDSIEAIENFAGDDYESAVISDEARKILSRFDSRVIHYEVAATDGK